MLTETRERVSDYLESLVRCEEAVAEFYGVCAAAWPDEGAFWHRLAEEELAHAVRLEMLRSRVRRTPHGVGLLRPYPQATLDAFVRSIAGDIAQIRAGAMPLETALVHARDLEQSLIASQPLRGLSFDDPRFPRYWGEISAQIAAHARRIVDRMAQGPRAAYAA
jgi:hypothetical protein